MSDYSGPGIYEIIPKHAQDMSLNVWEGATTPGTAMKLYQRTPNAKNTHFVIAAAGGTQSKPEKGDREYYLIAANSGLYVASNDSSQVTVELRTPLDVSIRWKLQYTGNGTFNINNVGTGKQLNVRGSGKTAGTDIITYAPADTENAQFVLKSV